MFRVHIYTGSLALVGKSGVGQAANHQHAALEQTGASVVTRWQPRSDVIHLNTVLPCSLGAARRARREGIPVIWYGHSTEADFRHSFVGSDLLAPLVKRWLCLCYNQADLILTPTPYSAAILRSYGLRPPVMPLSNGVDTGFFAPDAARRAAFRKAYGLAEGEKVVISVGHFMERKGILDFIALARSLPQVRFFWFGHTDPALVPRAIRKAMAAAPSNLTFPGFLSQSELRDAYFGADVFLFCSHEETEGIVVLEALACGTTTLVRDIPVYDGWLTDGVNVYKGRDLQELRTKLAGILQHRLPDVTAAGRQVALARSLPNIGRALQQIYAGLPARSKQLPASLRPRRRTA